jgi:NADPH-dependent 2,4-dienoyl-CoA reductase/sulfur reductase-like enzyme
MTGKAGAPTVAVIGAGPAGVRATETLARHDVRVVLFDEAVRPGGQIYRQPPPGAERPAAELYGFEAAKAVSIQNALVGPVDGVDYRPQSLVWNIRPQDGRYQIDFIRDRKFGAVEVEKVIIATGAVDRVVPFQGWTLPGVFTLGAAQIALKAQGVAVGSRVALVGGGPLLPLLINQYLAAGLKPVAALDATPFGAKVGAIGGLLNQPATLAKGLYYVAKARLSGVNIKSSIQAFKAIGDTRVTGLRYTDAAGKVHEVECDAIAASFGLRSEAQLADLAGCSFEFDRLTRQWQPKRDSDGRSSRAGVYLAGDGAAIGGADVAELTGAGAALALLSDIGLSVDLLDRSATSRGVRRQGRFRRAMEAAYPFPSHLLGRISDQTLVCRCEGITAGTLRDTIRGRAPGEVNRLKALTRVGMGRCQGRMCGHVAAEILAQEAGIDIAAAGRLRAQPPVKPIPLAAVSDGVGAGES